eukprot:CAMPEP_0197934442 /NCGR_PEP_ID=MMETSP1439-20131203/111807_1 /TAXON_ID=66791 /ORGANISM="Gonyaulax spinifera, Strain CCMP409" /LENGTH=494 /DNA_ID=CAMNT_0043557337 /DNA_START=36 /DNA_END=1518 /DNA_ORIENTATION=-
MSGLGGLGCMVNCCGCSGVPAPDKGPDSDVFVPKGPSSPGIEGIPLDLQEPRSRDPPGMHSEVTVPRLVQEFDKAQEPECFGPPPAGRKIEKPVSLRVVFDPEPKERTVAFRHRPLGITFEVNVLPLRLDSVADYAVELGLKPGWELRRVAGHDVSSPERTYLKVFEEIKHRSAYLPKIPEQPQLKVVFNSGGADRTVVFKERPIGLTFGDTVPLTVTEVAEPAASLGVQAGWTVRKIRERDVSGPSLSRAAVFSVFSDGVKPLRASMKAKTPTLSLTFSNDGLRETVLFTERPLGVLFAPDVTPLRLTKVTGKAAELGLEVDWTVEAIGEENVSEPPMPYDKVMKRLKQAIARLNEAPKGQKLDLTFTAPSEVGSKAFVFSGKAPQITFAEGMPLRVATVEGDALSQGVLPGWTVREVGDEDVSNPNMTEDAAYGMWCQALSRFRPGGVEGMNQELDAKDWPGAVYPLNGVATRCVRGVKRTRDRAAKRVPTE